MAIVLPARPGKLKRAMVWLPTAILAITVSLWLPLSAQSPTIGTPIVVIVNADNPVTSLSPNELRRIFISDLTRWETGKAVAPAIILAGAPERTSFLKLICGMNDDDFERYFLTASFAGKSIFPPREFSTPEGIKTFVATSPGGIGFVTKKDFYTGSNGIKPIRVDGLTAADPAYKLKM